MESVDGLYRQVEVIIPHKSEQSSREKSIFLMEGVFLGKVSAALHSLSSQVMLSIMTVVISTEVIGRYMLGSGLRWSQEVCGLAFFLFVFCTQSNTLQHDKHIRMDIFYDRFGPFFKMISNCLTIICGIIFYSAIVYQGISDLRYQFFVSEGSVELELPLWPFSAMMVFSSLLVVLFLVQFVFKHIFSKVGE